MEFIERVKQELQLIIDELSELVCLLDHQGHILRANRTVERWGLKQVVAVRGCSLHELIHPVCPTSQCYLEAFWHRTREAVAQGQTTTCAVDDTALQRRLSIEIRPFQDSRDQDESTAAGFALVIIRDLSQHRQGEEAPAKGLTTQDRAEPTSLPILYDVSRRHTYRRIGSGKAFCQELTGISQPMQHVRMMIREVARVNSTVLIEGETGTGKELVARAIHHASPRHQKPFVAVNGAGLSEAVITSQLFGHKRGAFTDAITDHEGFFEAANGGTLFLDEIGDMPLAVQASLLRVLQEREIIRLGESRPRPIDVRILAATQHDLSLQVAAGAFRADLLYRLRIIPISLPTLRQRQEDIPLLAKRFLDKYCAELAKDACQVSPEAMGCLLSHAWPGNVRELQNAMEYAALRCQRTVLQPEHLPPELTSTYKACQPVDAQKAHEKRNILDALAQTGGNRRQAARLLGIGKSTLYRRLAHYDLAAFSAGSPEL